MSGWAGAKRGFGGPERRWCMSGANPSSLSKQTCSQYCCAIG